MNYEQKLELIKSQAFGKKVAFAFIVAAGKIMSDAAASAEAKTWAVGVLSDRASKLQQNFAASLCVADKKIADAGKDALDEDIQKVVDRNLGAIQSLQDKA